VLLDVILGWGAHADPAGQLVRGLGARPADGPAVVASVTGTEGDPQVRSAQVRKLTEAGVVVAPSNAAAAAIALQCLQ
jgi:FdrA protein